VAIHKCHKNKMMDCFAAPHRNVQVALHSLRSPRAGAFGILSRLFPTRFTSPIHGVVSRLFPTRFTSPIHGVVPPAPLAHRTSHGDGMDAGGRATQEQLPDAQERPLAMTQGRACSEVPKGRKWRNQRKM